MNELSITVLGKKIFPNFQPPAEYTGELYGAEYLYAQSGTTFQPASEGDLLDSIDEGFGDIDEELSAFHLADSAISDVTVALPSDSESEDDVSTGITDCMAKLFFMHIM